MMKTLQNFVSLIWSKIQITSNLVAENLALRQHLAVMKRTNKRPKIRMMDRLFRVLLSRIWHPWRKSLVIVTPDTVVRWHRKEFKLFRKFKSSGPGRPRIGNEIRKLVRKMAVANPGWGAPRIHGELLKLGFEVCEPTVSDLMPRRPRNSKPSQTWRTFLKNHASKCSIDFFTVPTLAFNLLFVLVILIFNHGLIFAKDSCPGFSFVVGILTVTYKKIPDLQHKSFWTNSGSIDKR